VIKEDPLYNVFLIFLNERIIKGEITKNQYHLFKISEDYFNKFKIKYNKDLKLKRHLKIKSIL